MHDHAAPRVFTDRSLFPSIVAFADGVPFFALQVKRQLQCVEPQPVAPAPSPLDKDWSPTANRRNSIGTAPEDVELWQNACAPATSVRLKRCTY